MRIVRERKILEASERESNYMVWMPASGQPPTGCHVYVLELDEAEVCARKCLGRTTKPRSIKDKLVLRFWCVARRVHYGKTDRSSGRIAAEKGHRLIEMLMMGYLVRPDYIKPGREKDYDGIRYTETTASATQDHQG